MKSNEIFKGDEISLKEAVGQSIKPWRKYLIVAVVFAVLLGCYKLVPSVKIYSDPELRESYKLRADNKISYLENNISDLKYEIEKQEDYFNESVYININPLQVQKGTLSYYVSTPATGTSEFDYAENIVHAYEMFFSSGDLVDKIAPMLSYGIEPKYLTEIISVNKVVQNTQNTKSATQEDKDTTGNYIDIEVLHSDPEKLQEIMSCIKTLMDEYSSGISTQVGQFKISLVSDNITVVTDTTIKEARSKLDSSITDLENQLSEKNSSLSSAYNSYIDGKNIAKNTAIFAVIGFILGLILSIGCYFMYVVFAGKLISANQVENSFGLKVAGDYCESKKNKLDRMAERLVGENPNSEYEEWVKIAAFNTISFTDKKAIIIDNLVCDDISSDIVSKFSKFDFTKEYTFIEAHGTLEKYEILEKLGKETGVIVVTKKLGTKNTKLRSEVDISNKYDCDFIGVITI